MEQFKASIQEGVDQLKPGTTCLNPSVGWPLEGMGDVGGSGDKVVCGGMALVDGAWLDEEEQKRRVRWFPKFYSLWDDLESMDLDPEILGWIEPKLNSLPFKLLKQEIWILTLKSKS